MPSTVIHNENELLCQLASGNEHAFHALLKAYWNTIYCLALTYLKSPELARDAVQDVFMKVWEKREQFSSVGRFDSYLFIMTRNHVVSELRKKIMAPLEDHLAEMIPEQRMVPDLMFDAAQTNQAIEKAISLLPEPRKEMFLLSRRDNLSYDEIAIKMQVSKFSVKGNIAKALNFLREYLTEEAGVIFNIVAALLFFLF